MGLRGGQRGLGEERGGRTGVDVEDWSGYVVGFLGKRRGGGGGEVSGEGAEGLRSGKGEQLGWERQSRAPE